jgi:hypothetical protein
MDSSGLGTVMALYVSARTRGCKLELLNASDQIRACSASQVYFRCSKPRGTTMEKQSEGTAFTLERSPLFHANSPPRLHK